MRTVTIRHGNSVDDAGFIRYDESPSTYEEAERIVGHRLDRRKAYCIINGQVCESASWTQCCSGCADDRENVSCDRGMGCHECGYQGVVRTSMWFPVDGAEPADAALASPTNAGGRAL